MPRKKTQSWGNMYKMENGTPEIELQSRNHDFMGQRKRGTRVLC